MECLKFNKEKIDFEKSGIWNVWKQFDIDIESIKEPLEVEKHYMPYMVQEELLAYLRKNYRKLTLYKRSKKNFNNSIIKEVLRYFPTGIKNDTVQAQLRKEGKKK